MKKVLWIVLLIFLVIIAYAASGVFFIDSDKYVLVVSNYRVYGGKNHAVFKGRFGWAPRFLSDRVVFSKSFSDVLVKFSPLASDSTPVDVQLRVSLKVPHENCMRIYRKFGRNWERGIKVYIEQVLQNMFSGLDMVSGINTSELSSSLKKSLEAVGVRVSSVIFEKVQIPEPYLSIITKARMYEIEQAMMERKLEYVKKEYSQLVDLLGKSVASDILLMREAHREGAKLYIIPRNDTSFVLKFYEGLPLDSTSGTESKSQKD